MNYLCTPPKTNLSSHLRGIFPSADYCSAAKWILFSWVLIGGNGPGENSSSRPFKTTYDRLACDSRKSVLCDRTRQKVTKEEKNSDHGQQQHTSLVRTNRVPHKLSGDMMNLIYVC